MSRWISSTGLGFFGGGQGKKSRVSGWCRVALDWFLLDINAGLPKLFGFWTWFIWSTVLDGDCNFFWETFPMNKNRKTWWCRSGSLFFRNNFSDLVVIHCRAPVSQQKQTVTKQVVLAPLATTIAMVDLDCLRSISSFMQMVRVIEILNKYSISIIFIEAFPVSTGHVQFVRFKKKAVREKGSCEKKSSDHPVIPIGSSSHPDIRVGLEAGKWDKATCVFSKTFRALPCRGAHFFLFYGAHFFEKMGIRDGFWDTRKCKGYYNIKHLGASGRRRIPPSFNLNSRSTT